MGQTAVLAHLVLQALALLLACLLETVGPELLFFHSTIAYSIFQILKVFSSTPSVPSTSKPFCWSHSSFV